MTDADLQGLRGQVLITTTRTRRGKVSIVANDRTLTLLAITADASSKDEHPPGEAVTVVKVEDGVAHIAGEDFIL